MLAHLARLNFLPTAYAAPAETRDLRLYVRHREKLVQDRTQSKNRVHAVLASYNLRLPGTNPYGKAGREWLQEKLNGNLLRPAAKRVITDHLMLIDQLDAQVAALENDLVLTPEQDAAVRLLKTIPGVGPVIATTIVAEIGDVRRFNSPKALCNWAGLTPRIRSSAGITGHGHISKQGSPFLRNAMTQTANGAVRYSKRWSQVYRKLQTRCAKKVARVAVARRLLTVVYHMLKRNELYQENYSLSPVSRGA